MKKTLFLFSTFFCFSIAMAQTNCNTATEIQLNSTTTAPSFTNENGTAPTLLCGLTVNAGTKGKWYKYVATDNINVTVSTLLAQNNNIDTRVIVYSGSCGNLVCVGSNDDYAGSQASQLSFNVIAGTTYIIAFDNRFNNNGFDFTFRQTAAPGVERLSFTTRPITGIAGTYNNCIVDMNGDYKDDIVSAINNTQLAISYQQANGTFTTTTFTVPNTSVQPSWSIAAGDYDNNGYNDLIYGSGNGIVLLKANTDGTAFSTFRKPENYLTQRTNFVDINNDGKLDAFVCDDNSPNRYYYNDGSGNIGNQNQGALGIFPTGGNYASNWFDYDNDGDIDMHMSKCGQGGSGAGGNIDEMYRNNGNGTFTNVAADANLAAPEQSWSSAVGDFNNDGWMDIILGVNATSDGNTNVKRNNGDGTFTSVTAGSGFDLIFSTGREYVAHDFDNDGFLDVLGSGDNIMFGDGNFHFVPNSTPYLISPVDRPIGDLNDDGFLDIQYGTNVLFNNGNSNKWIKISLEGVQSNRNGIGARVEIYGAWGKQIRYIQSGTGFQNMSSLNAHFGIGQATAIEKVIIKWPSGIIDTVLNPSPNQTLHVKEAATLGITENTIKQFSLYPNPTADFLNIKLDEQQSEITGAKIYDLTGRMVSDIKVQDNKISVQSLTTGSYVIILQDIKGEKYSQKFIKQ